MVRMPGLTRQQSRVLEDELISIFQENPSEPYQSALDLVQQRHSELQGQIEMRDLNYRIPKLRRSGKIPASPRMRASGTAPASMATASMHPVARAYQELEDAKVSLDDAEARYSKAQEDLRAVLRENLPEDLIQSLARK